MVSSYIIFPIVSLNNDQKYEGNNKIVGLGEHTPGFLSRSFNDRLAS